MLFETFPKVARLSRGAVIAVASLALTVSVSAATAEPPSSAPATSSPAKDGDEAAGPEDPTFTLITGDVVALTGEGEDASAVVVEDVPPLHDVVIAQTRQGVVAVPGVASKMLADGQLDLRLFNLSLLDDAGYSDQQRASLPLIAQETARQARMGAQKARRGPAGDVPGTAKDKRALPSIRSYAVQMRKGQAERFFDGVTVPEPGSGSAQQPGNAGAGPVRQLAPGYDRVWLDAPVETMDDATNEAIGAPATWESGLTGEGQTIAVIDTGIDSTHPDFEGKIAAGKSCVPDSAYMDPEDAGSWEDDHYHGTHVASTALGSGAASDGQYAGVAKDAELVVAKALDSRGSGQTSWIIECMEWAAKQAPVVNMSLGSTPSDGTDPLSLAIDRISEDTGTLFVVAAGNWGGYNFDRHGTVSAPSTADRALSVGNVRIDQRPFVLDRTSSIGPRRGDHALKPQITAPGHQVIGAEAAMSRCRCPLPTNDQYMKLTGTSMAAPHVAGAAALLRQQHPDWSAEQLKDALVSTTQPNADPLYQRGTGTLDIKRASQQQVHATGTLDLGAPRYSESPQPLDGVVTYTNSGDADVELDLDVSYVKAPDGFIGEPEAFTPDDGSVTWGSDHVVVPAHSSVDVPVTVKLADMPYGSVYAEVVATTADEATRLVTAVSWSRETEKHQLKVRAIDPDGLPAQTGAYSFMVLTNLDTGLSRVGVFQNGEGYFQYVDQPFYEPDPLLAPGRYSLSAVLGGFEEPPYFNLTSWTVASEPEIVLDRDRTISFDARDARPWQVDTPRPSTRQGEAAFVTTLRTDEQDVLLSGIRVTVKAAGPDAIRTLPTTNSVSTGGYRMEVKEHREAPHLTVTTVGRWPVTIHAQAPSQSSQRRDCAGDCMPFEVNGAIQLLDVGSRTAADQLDAVRGRVVLALEDPPVPVAPGSDWRESAVLDELVQRLADAGATGVLVEARQGTDPWRAISSELHTIPVGVISHEDATRLRAQAGSDEIRVLIDAQPVSPYTYDLVTHLDDSHGDGSPISVRKQDLATVQTWFHHNAGPGNYNYRRMLDGYHPFQPPGTAQHDFRLIPAGTVRHEYVSVAPEIAPLGWQTIGGRGGPVHRTPRYETQTWSFLPRPGETVEHHVGGGPLRAWATGAIYQSRGRIVTKTPYMPWAEASGPANGTQANGGWWPNEAFNSDRLRATVTKDGQVMCDDWNRGMWDREDRCILAGPGTYTGTMTATRPQSDFDISTEVGVNWTANLPMPSESTSFNDTETAPFVDPDWSLPVDETDTLRDGAQLTVRAHYVDDVYDWWRNRRALMEPYVGDHGEFTVRAWVSTDDGTTWQQLGETEVSQGGETVFDLPELSGEFLSVRVALADDAGNSVDAHTLRAARLPS